MRSKRVLSDEERCRLEAWESLVLARFNEQCAGCGTRDGLVVRPLVPFGAGGRLEPSNGEVICAECQIARKAARRAQDSRDCPVCVWLSRTLSQRVEESLTAPDGYCSRSRLVDELMGVFLEHPDRLMHFSTLYQDRDDAREVKCNLRVNRARYDRFKVTTRSLNLTVREAVVTMLLAYLDNPQRSANPDV